MRNPMFRVLAGLCLCLSAVSYGMPPLGSPAVIPGAKVEIEPNPMFVFFANAVDPKGAKIHVGDFSDNGHILQDIDLSSIVVNDSILPASSAILPSYPGFSGDVLETSFPIRGFILGYGLLWDYNDLAYTITGTYSDGQPFGVSGIVTIIGRRSGDANGDFDVNVADAVYLVTYIFANGRPPAPLQAGDCDCDGEVNVSDVVYLMNYIFADGPEPCAGR